MRSGRGYLSVTLPDGNAQVHVSPPASMHPSDADGNISVVLRDCRRKNEKKVLFFFFSHGLSGQEIVSVCS